MPGLNGRPFAMERSTSDEDRYFAALIHWLIDSSPPDPVERDCQLKCLFGKLNMADRSYPVTASSCTEKTKVGGWIMKCSSCGREVPQGSRFCPYCGTALVQTDRQVAEMVARIRKNPQDQDAITVLFNETYKTAYSTANAMLKGGDEIQDVIQEAFLKALNILDSLNLDSSFRSWYRTIVRTSTIDYLRKNNKLPTTPASSLEPDDEEDGFGDNSIFDTSTPLNMQEQKSLDEQLTPGDIQELVQEVIKSLPQDQQTMVALRYYEDMKEKDIAEQLGFTESKVKSGLSRAKARMKKSLEEYSRRTGTKLYSFAPIPFILWLFSRMESNAASLPADTKILSNVLAVQLAEKGTAAGTTTGKTMAAAGRKTAEQTVAKTTGSTAARTAAATAGKAAGAAAGKAVRIKVAAVIVAAVVAGGGATAAVTYRSQQQKQAEESEVEQRTPEQLAGYKATASEATEEENENAGLTDSAAAEETTQEDADASYLITGPEINDAFFASAEDKIPRDMGDSITYVSSVDRSDSAPEDADDAIDISESGLPTYVWYEDSHIYWYSEASTVYLNADSSEMFFRLYSCQSIDLTGMDTSLVTNMDHMFGATSISTLDLSTFDTSKVTNMSYMFVSDPLKSLDLSGFDMSSMPATDPGDLESSPVYDMFFQLCMISGVDNIDDIVTWWPGVTDAEKEAAQVDELSGDSQPAAETAAEEDKAVQGDDVVTQNADGTYRINADGYYSFGELPDQYMGDANSSYYITSYDLQNDQITFTTNSIRYYGINYGDAAEEPAGTYVVPISSDCSFVYGGDIFASLTADANTIDGFRNILSQYGDMGVLMSATIEDGKIVQFDLEA